MAQVLSECRARSHGERKLASLLSAFEDDNLLILFTIDFIPGARECDVLLIQKDIGVFVIEAKTYSIEALSSVSCTEWTVKGRTSKESPILQAYRQYEGLRDYLSKGQKRLPFICSTVCFPKISRKEFKTRYQTSMYASEVSDSLIFSEDLYSGYGVFLKRLKYIIANPPARMGREPYRVPSTFIDAIKSLTEPAVPVTPTINERERLKALECGITRQVRKEYPVGACQIGVFYGQPGTGKTFRLLSIGLFHAYEGKRVLFTCFNKTLASDIRRLLSFNDKLKASQGVLDILDINQLAVRCFDTNGIGYIESEQYDEWGRMLVEDLSNKNDLLVGKFDVILIDEAQDMKGWQLDLLTFHAERDATIALAIGKGQELYHDTSSAEEWISTFERDHKLRKHNLKRNFRNPRIHFLVAKAFYECWPDNFKALRHIFDSTSKVSKQLEISFDRDTGEQPRYITLPVMESEFADQGSRQDEIVADLFSDILDDTFSHLGNDLNMDPVGILVLVPESTGLHCRAARIALDGLTKRYGIRYIDYTREETRRVSAYNDQVRLCTFHSARGLEGEHVVVFGLERLEFLVEKVDAPCKNIAFVALSRAVFTNTIVCRADKPRTATHKLCERIWEEMTAQS